MPADEPDESRVPRLEGLREQHAVRSLVALNQLLRRGPTHQASRKRASLDLLHARRRSFVGHIRRKSQALGNRKGPPEGLEGAQRPLVACRGG